MSNEEIVRMIEPSILAVLSKMLQRTSTPHACRIGRVFTRSALGMIEDIAVAVPKAKIFHISGITTWGPGLSPAINQRIIKTLAEAEKRQPGHSNMRVVLGNAAHLMMRTYPTTSRVPENVAPVDKAATLKEIVALWALISRIHLAECGNAKNQASLRITNQILRDVFEL